MFNKKEIQTMSHEQLKEFIHSKLNGNKTLDEDSLYRILNADNFTIEIFKFLLENNVDLSIQGRNCETMLQEFCYTSVKFTPEILKFLLEKHRDTLNTKDKHNNTMLGDILLTRCIYKNEPSLEMLELLLPNKDLFDERTINKLVEKNRPAMSLMLMCHGYFPTNPFLPQTNLGIVANILQDGEPHEKENLMLFLQNKSSPGELLKANCRFLPKDSREMIKTALCSATFFAQKSQKKWPKPVLMNILSQSLNTVDWLHVDQRNENEITEKLSAISQFKF